MAKLIKKSNVLALSLMGMMLCPLPVSADMSNEVLNVANIQGTDPLRGTKISGTVVDSNGESIIGATIIEKGTKNAAISDIDGNFTINVSKSGATLTVNYIGYKSQDVKCSGGSVNVVLVEDAAQLEDVVVIGYGSVKKKDLTGSVVQIRPDRLASENPQTVQDVLRGTAGLNVGASNDAKGGGSLNIRGQRSVYSDGGHNDPLIILDGMQFYGELSEINPDDIEQIDVLKDASSAAVYGAKAANGVIIVTTKKGKDGKPVINFSTNLGWTKRASVEKLFSTNDYLQHKVDYFESSTYGFNNDGQWVPYATGNYQQNYFTNPTKLPSDVSLEQWRGYTTQDESVSDYEVWLRRINFGGNLLQNALAGKVADWEGQLFHTGFQQDYNASVSGATDKVNYYLSAGYLNNEGVRRGDYFKTIRLNGKLNMNITKWLSVGASVNFQDRSDDADPVSYGIRWNSPFSDIYDEDGNYAQYPSSNFYSQRGDGNLFSRQYTSTEKGFTVLNSQFNATVKLPYNITYAFNIAPRYQYYYKRQFMSADLPDSNPKDRGVNRDTSKRFDYSLNNTITWNQTFAKKHDVTLTLVQEAEERRYWSDNISARHILPTDALGFHYVAGATMEESSFGVDDTHETADALLARVQYVYDNRYLLTASVRRDGYCAFGANYPHATFPSVAVAWTFSNEKFWESFTDVMDYGKIRLSWGKNGNRSLADPYVALSNLTTGKYMGYIYNNTINDMVYLRVDRLGNPNLQWEKSTAYNLGFDFSFLKGAITGNIDFYKTETKDMIMQQSLPGFIGFNSITTNLGQVDNSGFEITINSRNINKPNFKWNTSFSLSYNKNKIKHLYGNYDENGVEQDDIANDWHIGHAIDEIWDFKVEGIWQVSEAEEAAKYGQQPGDPKVWNNPDNDIVQEDGTVKIVYNNEDKRFLGHRTAPVRLSMRNEFTILKNISVGLSVYGMFGHKACRNGIYDSDAFMNNDNGGGFLLYKMQNQPWKRYWTPETPYNDVARIEAKGPVGAEKPRMYLNRSFLRFDNLSIGYTFPKSLIQPIRLTNLKVYANIKNLGTIHSSDWYYGDPEMSTNGNSFATRTYTIGLNVTF